jgi:hypothetical protein
VQWDFAYGTRKNLTWCASNCPLGPQKVPVPVVGELKEPYALMSVKSRDSITLRAVPYTNYVYHTPIVCRFNEQVLKDCNVKSKISELNEIVEKKLKTVSTKESLSLTTASDRSDFLDLLNQNS